MRAARAKKGKKDDRPEQFSIPHGLRNEPPGSERLTQNGLFEGKDPFFSFKEASMTSIADSSIQIQTSSELAPCAPSWFGEVESKALTPAVRSTPLSRAERAHTRLYWETRLARNVYPPGKGQVAIKLCGVPEAFAGFLS